MSGADGGETGIEACVALCAVVYANFGSTGEIPIWVDTSALVNWRLNWRPEGRSEVEEHELVRQVLQMFRAAGAEVRVSFYSLSLDQGRVTNRS